MITFPTMIAVMTLLAGTVLGVGITLLVLAKTVARRYLAERRCPLCGSREISPEAWTKR